MKRVTKTLTIATLCSLGALAGAASVYPSTYPFEKNEKKPPSLPKTDPMFTDMGNAKNPGGYYSYLEHKCDPYAADRPSITLGFVSKENAMAGFTECRYLAWFAYSSSKTSTQKLETQNCSDPLVAKHEFDDSATRPTSLKVMGVEVCKNGKCCDHLKSSKRSKIGWKPEKAESITDTMTNSGCKIDDVDVVEKTLCSMVWKTWNCNIYMPDSGTTNSRDAVMPCYDMRFMMYLKCKLLATVTVAQENFQTTRYDTESFAKLLTVEQTIANSAIGAAPDKVCHPYSYFYPASPPSTPGTSPGTSPGTPASAAMWSLQAVMAASVLFAM